MIGTVDVKTRPLKIAFLVDPNNKKQAKEAIQLSSTLWGGQYFPIIPLYKRMPATWREKPIKTPSAKSVILGYVDAFDPDIFVQLSKDIPKFISDIGIKIVKSDEVWKDLDESRYLIPQYGLGIFEILNDIFEDCFKFKMKYPVKVIFPNIPKQYDLLWTSWLGDMPKKLLPVLEKYYFKPLEIENIDIDTSSIKKLMRGNVLFPRRIIDHKITRYNKSGFRNDGYIYYLDATKVEDIIDFWNLRAIGKSVLPIPKQLKDDKDLKDIAIRFLKAHRIPWSHNPQVCDYGSIIRSRNCDMEEIKEYAKTLKIKRKKDDPSDSPFFSLQHWYPRVWNEWARDKDGAMPGDIYGDEEDSIEINDIKDLDINIPSLLPKFSNKRAYSSEPRCANEVTFRFYGADQYIAEVFPKSSGDNFIRAISGLASFRGDWRIGNNGLVKLVRDGYRGAREMPLAEKVFFAWLEDLGWKPKLSPPGLLAKQIYKNLEGHPSILKNEKVLGLIEYMNGGSVQQDGSPVSKNKINQERPLPVGEIRNRLKTDPQHKSPYDYLVRKGFFKLGLRIKCPNCSRDSWYPVENVKDFFDCPKCLNRFDSIGNLESSVWAYKTTGPFSVPDYAEGAYAVLLTLDFFDEFRMTTMHITPTTSFAAESSSKKTLEADFAAFWQDAIYGEKKSGVLFGECKTYGQFKDKDFKRMRYFAKTFPGAVIVFSTLRKSLTPKEKASITRIAKRGRKYWKNDRPINPVLILTGNELLHNYGPPSCWEKSIKEKFNRVAGLLSVCDATQQIYLGLRSWHDEWHDKWREKYQNNKNLKEKDAKSKNNS